VRPNEKERYPKKWEMSPFLTQSVTVSAEKWLEPHYRAPRAEGQRRLPSSKAWVTIDGECVSKWGRFFAFQAALQACGQRTACAVPPRPCFGRCRASTGAKRLKRSSSLGNPQPDATLMLLLDYFFKVHHSACASLDKLPPN